MSAIHIKCTATTNKTSPPKTVVYANPTRKRQGKNLPGYKTGKTLSSSASDTESRLLYCPQMPISHPSILVPIGMPSRLGCIKQGPPESRSNVPRPPTGRRDPPSTNKRDSRNNQLKDLHLPKYWFKVSKEKTLQIRHPETRSDQSIPPIIMRIR